MEPSLDLATFMDPVHFELKTTNDQLLRVIDDLKQVIAQRDEVQHKMSEAHFHSLYLMALGAEFREGRSGHRLLRIGITAAILARAAGMNEDYCKLIKRAAPLHDIGMATIPDTLLHKQELLDGEEWRQWRNHTEIGARLLSNTFDSPLIRMAAEIATAHHENFKGNGYPAGLAGEQIPLSGRIVALVSYFEIHTDTIGNQAYLMLLEPVLASIRELSGHRFDPKLVDLLSASLENIENARIAIEMKAVSLRDLAANSAF